MLGKCLIRRMISLRIPLADRADSLEAQAKQPGAPLLPNANWESSQTLKVKQWALLAAGILSGVVLAIGLCAFLISQMQDERQVALQDTLQDTEQTG